MQTSAKPLTRQNEHLLFKQLSTLLADLDHPKQMEIFLREFLTQTEQLVFAKRLAILWELHQGKSYEEIKDKLNVSSATISSVSEIISRKSLTSTLALLVKDARLSRWLDQLLTRLS